jgi:hypothetical protein
MMSDLPTKPGPYYWREKDGDEWEIHTVFIDDELNHTLMALCPIDDTWYATENWGGQWLPIPTAEVLARLAVTGGGIMTSNKPPSCDLPPEFYRPKLKECPFCGTHPETSGNMFSRDRRRIVKSVRHPHTGKCPLDILIFREGEWNCRNSIPRRSEVLELLRLVDEVTGWENDLIDTNEFSEDGEAMINDIGNLREYAAILRKEMGE